MHKFLKYFVYTSLSIHLSIIIVELCRIPFLTPPDYLKDYNLIDIRISYMKSVILNVVKIFLCFVTVFLVDYKRLEDIKEEQDIPEDLNILNNVVDSTEDNKWNWLVSKFLFYRTVIVVYLYMISCNLNRFNIILYTLGPFIAYKVLFKLYTKYRYYKIFIWPFFVAVSSGAYYLLKMKKSQTSVINNKIIPPDVSDYLSVNKYEVMVFKISSDICNVGVVGMLDKITIFIIGDILKILSVKEFTSVLFHEIGHVANKSILFRMLVSKSLSIVMYIMEFLMIICNKKLLSRTNTDDDPNIYVNNLIKLFVVLSISLNPYMNLINNFYSNIDEIYADQFSMTHYRKKEYLISSLIKLTIKNNAYYDSSYLYNLMYFSHPSLRYRIELINRF
jgi:Zn-dependent protease with chaperone function